MLYIDYKSGLPIYEQVYNGIMRLAALGILQPGAQLPSVRSVAADAGVNPNTVQKAYAMLERDGVIVSVPGRGSFLAEKQELADTRKRAALEKLREAVTDALRAMRLKAGGYSVSVLELTDPENTPKNTLIRATKNEKMSQAARDSAEAEYKAALRFILGEGADSYLEDILK